MKNTKTSGVSYLIQFNAGKQLSASVTLLAKEWDVQPCEVVKRLATLAAMTFDFRHHNPVARLSEHVTGHQKFISAAHQAATLIDSHSQRLSRERGKEVEPTSREKYEILMRLVEHNEQPAGSLVPAGFEA